MAGPQPENRAIALAPFISPQHSPNITWLFNGDPYPEGFPNDVFILNDEVLLRSPLFGSMRGNYTCIVRSEGLGTQSASFLVQVHGKNNREWVSPDASIV